MTQNEKMVQKPSFAFCPLTVCWNVFHSYRVMNPASAVAPTNCLSLPRMIICRSHSCFQRCSVALQPIAVAPSDCLSFPSTVCWNASIPRTVCSDQAFSLSPPPATVCPARAAVAERLSVALALSLIFFCIHRLFLAPTACRRYQ